MNDETIYTNEDNQEPVDNGLNQNESMDNAVNSEPIPQEAPTPEKPKKKGMSGGAVAGIAGGAAAMAGAAGVAAAVLTPKYVFPYAEDFIGDAKEFIGDAKEYIGDAIGDAKSYIGNTLDDAKNFIGDAKDIISDTKDFISDRIHGGSHANVGDEALALKEESIKLEEVETPTVSEQLVGHDMNVASGINDSMSFGEAFAAARQELGAGGLFVWHGNTYGTYYANEWNAMSAEDQDQYWADVFHTTSNIEYEPQVLDEQMASADTFAVEMTGDEGEALVLDVDEGEGLALNVDKDDVAVIDEYDIDGDGVPDIAFVENGGDEMPDILVDSTGDGQYDTLLVGSTDEVDLMADGDEESLLSEEEMLALEEDGLGMEEDLIVDAPEANDLGMDNSMAEGDLA